MISQAPSFTFYLAAAKRKHEQIFKIQTAQHGYRKQPTIKDNYEVKCQSPQSAISSHASNELGYSIPGSRDPGIGPFFGIRNPGIRSSGSRDSISLFIVVFDISVYTVRCSSFVARSHKIRRGAYGYNAQTVR